MSIHGQLANHIVNLVPIADLRTIARWCDDTTQTVGVYPERLCDELVDVLALAGAQGLVPLQSRLPKRASDDGAEFPGMPHDGIEPMRRMMRWVIDERVATVEAPLLQAAE